MLEACVYKTADENVVRGRVLLPDGKPAAGARVLAVRRFWTARFGRRPLASAKTNPNGEFVIRFQKKQPHLGAGGGTWIAALADGFGPEWSPWGKTQDSEKELVLKLVAESPLRGRIVDLEGRPVRGVRAKPIWRAPPPAGAGAWLKGDSVWRRRAKNASWKTEANCRRTMIRRSSQPSLTTTAGLRSAGSARVGVARLELRGETIAMAEIDVVTRPDSTDSGGKARVGKQANVRIRFHAAQVAPTRPIVGTVRDATTGQRSLAGVSIQSRHLASVPTAQEGVLETKTDAQGRYRLIGMARQTGVQTGRIQWQSRLFLMITSLI